MQSAIFILNKSTKHLVLLFIECASAFFRLLGLRACKFHPTCSKYAKEAIDKFGVFTGGWMALKRLARCHPLSSGGYDPVGDA